MKIVVDCRYIRIGQHDGISRYTAGMVAALAKRHRSPCWSATTASSPCCRPAVAARELADEPPRAARGAAGEQARPDVVFSPMQTMGSWGATTGCC